MSPSVALVDPSPAARKVIGRCLRRHGLSLPLIEAAGLRDLSRLSRVELSLVVCAYELDAIRAPEFIQALRLATSSVPVGVFYSGTLSLGAARRCFDAGAEFVLPKTSLVAALPESLKDAILTCETLAPPRQAAGS